MTKTATTEAYVPRVKRPNEATPPKSNYKATTYRTGDGDQIIPARPGSLDFLKYKSKVYTT